MLLAELPIHGLAMTFAIEKLRCQVLRGSTHCPCREIVTNASSKQRWCEKWNLESCHQFYWLLIWNHFKLEIVGILYGFLIGRLHCLKQRLMPHTCTRINYVNLPTIVLLTHILIFLMMYTCTCSFHSALRWLAFLWQPEVCEFRLGVYMAIIAMEAKWWWNFCRIV